MRLLALLLVCAALAAGCGEAGGPRWVELARAEVRGRLPEGEVALPEGGRARFEEVEGELWLATELPRAAWREEEPGRFRAALPLIAVGSSRVAGAPYRLTASGRSFVYSADPKGLAEPGRFTTEILALKLALAPGEEPPEVLTLAAVLDHARPAGGVLRFAGRRQSGAGFWVPAGESRRVALECPTESVLRFGLSLEPLLGTRAGRMAAHTFRVELDGALLLEHTLSGDVLGEAASWHEVALPSGGVRKAEFTFSVSGPPALVSVVEPVFAPRDSGRPAARPWDEARPDLVVFLADTFRADNLAAYGSTLELTPEIDRFAAEARVFARAWTTSTHTLPTHAALFTGYFPHQSGLVDYFNPLPGAVETVAEKLAARGYRCVAVTDGVMVSQRHGLEQGFAWFDERVEVDTVERVRAALAADDGRPLFLFVQSYAVHAPYRPAPETRARLRGRLPVDGDFEALLAQAGTLGLSARAQPPEGLGPRAGELAAELRGLYLAKVTELDALFGRFRAELAQAGLAQQATLVFLSDHGESFLEHGTLFHATSVHEEELRVPLLVRGPRFAPGREERPVSLVDFTPTLAELVGLARDPEWGGVSWLAPRDARALLGFQARNVPEGASVALIEDGRKHIGRYWAGSGELGAFDELYDLGRDPGERANLALGDGPAAEPPAERRAELERSLRPLVTPEASNLSAEDLRMMQALGYGGEAPR